MPKVSLIDLTGQRFGRWTVLSEAPRLYKPTGLGPKRRWNCVCDCGNQKVVPQYTLTCGQSKSCGCLGKEILSEYAKNRVSPVRTHGHCANGKSTPEHKAWSSMRERCNNPNHRHYKGYGGRGITVCERWNSFENFFADMGPRPSDKHSIEREDNSLGYSPDNCVWATSAEQNRNKRNMRYVEIDGETRYLREWCRVLGRSVSTVSGRIFRGMDPVKALTTPSAPYTGGGRRRKAL